MADATPLHPSVAGSKADHTPEHAEATGDHPGGQLEVYVQAQGRPSMHLIPVALSGSVRDLVRAAASAGLTIAGANGNDVLVSAEDADEPLQIDEELGVAGIRHRSRVHLHRVRRVAVTVHFNGRQTAREFPPAATIERVFEWATSKKAFAMDPLDAAEHALQIAGTSTRPADDVHLGTLLTGPGSAVAFDLVPKRRVEG